MRASWYEKTGPAIDVLQIGKMETPEACDNEVRIKIFASGVNPADVKLRSGQSSYGYNFDRVIPNSDGAGIIDQVGSGVSNNLIGRRVWLFNGQRLGRAFGTAAEYICINFNFVTELPEHVSFDEGATLGIPGLTAYHSVFADGSVHGKTILITGGAGAVGFYATSLASWGGAKVLCTVSGDQKAKSALLAGAENVINYKKEDVAERVDAYTKGKGVDRLITVDFGGDLPWMTSIMRQNSCVSAYASDSEKMPTLDFFSFMRKNIQIRPFILNSLPPKELDDARFGINRWLIDKPNSLRPIAKKFSLENIIKAHELVESSIKFGTVIVNPKTS
tara:strand:- start:1381 stop:2379 length:999 start_codon:yes stop_codon:yes gene_type:complete